MGKIRFIEANFHYDGDDAMIFEGLNLEIDTAWKSAIVARNGKGKTTLLRLMDGQLNLTSGHLVKDVTTAYFPLEIANPEQLVLTLMKTYMGPFLECEEILENFVEGEAYYEAMATYLDLGGYELEADIKRECHRLKLKESVLNRPYEELSGGERTKIQMIMLFLRQEGFVLLDEPTNHLDMEGIDALGRYLASQSGYTVVSHHRDFLNLCADHVIALEKDSVVVRQDNFAGYDADYKNRQNLENKQRGKAQKEADRLAYAMNQRKNWSNKVEATKKKPSNSGSNGDLGFHDKGFIGAKSAKLMKRAKSIEARREKELEQKTALVKYQEHVPHLKFSQGAALKELLRVSQLAIGYEEEVLAEGIDFVLKPGDRLAIRGPNGCGKTTFLRTLLGENPPMSGLIKKDNRVKIAYVSQIPRYQLGHLREIIKELGLEESRFRSLLGAFSCHRDIFERDLSTFSLGELKKVDLAMSLYDESHLLIWDEPLNGLDIMTRQAIEEAILEQKPTLIFTEHDAEFVSRVSTGEVWLDKS